MSNTMAVRSLRAAPAQSLFFRRSPLAAAACACIAATAAQAQTQPAAPTEGQTMAPVIAKARAEAAAAVSGWGDVPLSQAPFQATLISSEQLRDRGVTRLSDAVKRDAGVTDSYNTAGYYDALTVRGFKIDNEFNYRRDGLPINAQTAIGLENKESIEVLKGTSGIQAGTSAPGGLVNYLVKRPTAEPIRRVTLGWGQQDSLLTAVDLSQRFGNDNAFGIRLNAGAEKLRPQTRNADGERSLFAIAADWRVTRRTLVEIEAETSKQSQPSVPGFSMLGDVVPSPADPDLNLNNQSWSQPVVFRGNTASIRLTQNLTDDWRATAHAVTQQLKTDDRVLFPSGCTADNRFDRYCADGTFDAYDYRSDNERRRTDALELALHGQARTGIVGHAVSTGVLRSVVRNRFYQMAYNPIGTGNVDGTAVLTPDPLTFDNTTNLTQGSTEFFVRDALKLPQDWTVWLGVRHTRLKRDTQEDGASVTQSFNTPSIAVSKQIVEGTTAYASWSQGAETRSTPALPKYTNRGTVFPVAKSRQIEFGLKGEQERFSWGTSVFQIVRPEYPDVGTCSSALNSCTRVRDGDSVHRGIDVNAGWRSGAWLLQSGVQYLHARRDNSADFDGKKPVNVPDFTGTASLRYTLPQVTGLSVETGLRAESSRQITPANDAQVGGYGLVDLGARYKQKVDSAELTWRAGVDNIFDKRAWREAPYQFSHVYLFPTEARTFRVTVEASL
jgi:iron complex outermembrane recepter protein